MTSHGSLAHDPQKHMTDSAECLSDRPATGGRFATTIHVLVSAVLKLMRVVRLPAGLALYRGLGGEMALPASFDNADENGCRGYAEWGFLSTTSNRATAVEVPGPLALRV